MNESGNVVVRGKCGISATILKDSVNPRGNRFRTFEIEYPRFILAEVNTHKMLEKNSSSSRAIPFNQAVQNILNNMAEPVHWGKNQAGMSAKEELDDNKKHAARQLWRNILSDSIVAVTKLFDLGLHKQIVNRILEPWSMMKTVISGTEFDNFYWLRDHSDAQPEFEELAHCMKLCEDYSKPEKLFPGMYHLPYVDTMIIDDIQYCYDSEGNEIDVGTALKISASCCAQTSYRKNDGTTDKAIDIFNKLVGADRKHASPFGHQGTPVPLNVVPFNPSTWTEGITHVRKDGTLCSGNLFGWIQYRQLIPNNTKW